LAPLGISYKKKDKALSSHMKMIQSIVTAPKLPHNEAIGFELVIIAPTTYSGLVFELTPYNKSLSHETIKFFIFILI
jgi:hypothetical protein